MLGKPELEGAEEGEDGLKETLVLWGQTGVVQIPARPSAAGPLPPRPEEAKQFAWLGGCGV